jgi:putative phosphoribosyl transferase
MQELAMMFLNRTQAGEKLAAKLQPLELIKPLVLAIPRGGVPVAGEIAKALSCPLDVIPLTKIPVPWSPEASYGVVAMDGTLVLNRPLVNRLELSERELELAAASIVLDAKKREQRYRGDKPFPELAGCTVILVDDGLSSGYSMLAAVDFAIKRKPRSLIVASPVSSDAAYRLLAGKMGISNLVVLVHDAEQAFSLSAHYKEFAQVTDNEVVKILASIQMS